MQHILILRELSSEETTLVKTLISDGEVKVITEEGVSVSINPSVPFEKLSETEKSKINFQTLNDILSFGDLRIAGMPVSWHLNFHGAGLWYYHKFRIYFNIRNQNYRISEIANNIAEASSALIFTSEQWLDSSYFDLNKIEWKKKIDSKEKLSWSSVLAYVVTVCIRLGKAVFMPLSKLSKLKVLSIDTVGQYRKILSLDGSRMIFENAYLGYLYQKKGNQIGMIDQLLIPKFKGADKYKFDKGVLKNHNGRTRLFAERVMAKAVFSIKGIRALKRNKNELNEKIQIIKKELGSDAENLRLLKAFEKLNKTSQFYLFKYFAYHRFFRDMKCKSILTTDENSPNFKIILDAAKQHGISTVGYQHGSIHDLHPAYIYTKTDMLKPPVPHVTITWGKKWEKLLRDSGNYKKEQLKIAGQIRTDVIGQLKESVLVQQNTILKQAGGKRIVLFATQPQRDPELRYRAAEDVVQACQHLENSYLVFKLHPRENDPEFYENIAQDYGLVDFAISRDEELYILLQLSDVVITCFSTVGSEALYFDKPLIILDHLKQDILNYHNDGVAFRATNSEELTDVLGKVLAKNVEMDTNRIAKYLSDSTCAIDGKVSERVWNYLNSGFSEEM